MNDRSQMKWTSPTLYCRSWSQPTEYMNFGYVAAIRASILIGLFSDKMAQLGGSYSHRARTCMIYACGGEISIIWVDYARTCLWGFSYAYKSVIMFGQFIQDWRLCTQIFTAIWLAEFWFGLRIKRFRVSYMNDGVCMLGFQQIVIDFIVFLNAFICFRKYICFSFQCQLTNYRYY